MLDPASTHGEVEREHARRQLAHVDEQQRDRLGLQKGRLLAGAVDGRQNRQASRALGALVSRSNAEQRLA